jgi:uncharacterized repeat protein (TIGR03803 family)
LALGLDGLLYGTTKGGGTNDSGTIFKIAVGGTLTTLSSSVNTPTAALVQASDGNFYGTDSKGGAFVKGSIFQITPAGVLTILNSFSGSDGSSPQGIAQHTDGVLYGTTSEGGAKSLGTAFMVTAGLGAFVEPLPSFGIVGDNVGLLGPGLTDSFSVSFNGTGASFSISSDSLISAEVPTGASTGPISVATTYGPVSSSQVFEILPSVSSFLPTAGLVGSTVTIEGSALTGAEAVSFGGTDTPWFTVNSDSQITATVPARAISGPIAVTTPIDKAASLSNFTVETTSPYCGAYGQQCLTLRYNHCCPGLVCVPASTRAFCELP